MPKYMVSENSGEGVGKRMKIFAYFSLMMLMMMIVDRGFCPALFHSHSVAKKYTEAYTDYKLVGLLGQTLFY